MARPYRCPVCSSYKTQSIGAITACVGVFFLAVGGMFSFLVFPIVIALAGVVMLGAAPFIRKRQCTDCKHKFTPVLAQ